MDIEQFRKAGYQAIDRICDYYYSLRDRPVAAQVEPGYLRQALPSSAPENGEDFQRIADDYQELILPGLTHWQHPSFFAYFPTACTFEGMLGDLYSSSTCNPGFNWACSPACTELEAIVMDWAAKLLGLSPAFLNTSGIGGGIIMTTASDSALTAVVAARSLYLRRHPNTRMEDLVICTTTQTHSLGQKAALVLGLQCVALEVSSKNGFGLTGSGLRTALKEEGKNERKVFILIVTVGTTSSGAIDNLSDIGQVAKDYPSMWIHVDAAWAGVALSCPEYRELAQLDAINEYGDSFCTNFHKWGLTNFDASTLWVKDRKYLTDALDVTPEFLRTRHGDDGTVIDYRNWHLGLGRRFRSVKLWFVLRSFGVEGLRKYIRRTITLNDQFADFIRSSSIFTLVTRPSFALSVFRIFPASSSLSLEELNTLNRSFHTRLSKRSDILLTQTMLNGVFCVRFAVGAKETAEEDIEKAFKIILQEAEEALKEGPS